MCSELKLSQNCPPYTQMCILRPSYPMGTPSTQEVQTTTRRVIKNGENFEKIADRDYRAGGSLLYM